jgi:hypothetical protein
MNKETVEHFSKQISQIYDVLISLTERVDKIEAYLCVNCNKEKVNDC